jgi:pteridine reductase
MIATNLAAPYFTSLYAARAMLAQESENGIKGKIVSVGDWATERPGRGVLPYIAAKGGLTTLTLALAKELAPHVTVNLIQPSTIDPPPGTTEADVQKTIDLTPMRRIGSPEDANRLILYLLEGTDYATGGVYRIDGGRYLGTDSQDL